jgi:oligopeptidase B
VQPPIAPRRTHVWDRPTGPAEDPWAWLRDRDDPETVAYLDAENAYADAWLAEQADLVEGLYQELKGRVQETDESVPTRHGDWWYVSRTEEGLDYPIHCRGRSAEAATEDVILDENAEAADHEFFEIGAFDVSPDHRLLAWSSDIEGGEQYVMHVRDLASGLDLPDRIERTYYGTAWSRDGEWLLYTRTDEAMRPYQVWRHRLGTDADSDVLVHQEDDERFFLTVELSRSEAWVVMSAESKTTTEVWLVPSTDVEQEPRVVRPRVDGHEYSVSHWGDRFVVVTNEDAVDFKVCTAPEDDPGSWTVLSEHQPGRRVTGASCFEGHLVLSEWSEAQPRLRIVFRDGTERVVDTGSEPCDIGLDANPEWSTSLLRFHYRSLTRPNSVHDEHVVTGARTLLKETPVLGVDLGRYRSARTWAAAPDGARVPIDLCWHEDTALDGSAPALLYGYGSYESSTPPWFSYGRLSLLDRGWVFAVAHPRGGGELGRQWYLDGKLLAKRNTFTDFLACAEHLQQEAYAARGRVAIRGGSAGGLLVGAAVTMAPTSFAAVVAEVPFVDVVTTMSDPSLPLTITEWEEWGDPRTEPYASYMLSYSPYDNTAPAPYPPLYITAGLNDPRVSYHEPAKWTAKLRAVSTGGGPVLLRTEMGAGHAGPSGRYDAWRDEARLLSFLLRTVR